MPHVTSNGDSHGSPGALLAAILEERKLGKRTLARKLLGPDATTADVNKKRDVVRKQAVPNKRFLPQTAEEYSRALNLPPDYFKSPPLKRLTPKQQLEAQLADANARLAVAERELAVRRAAERQSDALGSPPEAGGPERPAQEPPNQPEAATP